MKAITVEPGRAGSARFENILEPGNRDGSVLVEAIAVGVCGTDVEIVEGKYDWALKGSDRLVLASSPNESRSQSCITSTPLTTGWREDPADVADSRRPEWRNENRM
jgi:hypothetical protein